MDIQWNRGVKRRKSPFWESRCAVSLSLSALCAVTCSWSSGTPTWQRKISVCAQHEVYRKHNYCSKVVFKLEQLGRYPSPGIPVPGNCQGAGTQMWMFRDCRPAWAQCGRFLIQGGLQPRHQYQSLLLLPGISLLLLGCPGTRQAPLLPKSPPGWALAMHQGHKVLFPAVEGTLEFLTRRNELHLFLGNSVPSVAFILEIQI